MDCKHIMEIIDRDFPPEYALSWDNVGLLVGCAHKEVKKIYVALDATGEIVKDAGKVGADMLVTHHPLIFSAMKQVTDDGFIGSRVMKLIQHDISYFAMHTNYDVVRMGPLAADMLGIQNQEPLEMTTDGKDYQGQYADGNPMGIGRIGLIPACRLTALCERVKQVYGIPAVKVFGDGNQMITKAAILPGSGKGDMEAALDKGADVLITGDIDHHEGLDAIERGLAVIDAGHYGVEHIYIQDMKSFLEERLPGVEVVTAPVKHPFQII